MRFSLDKLQVTFIVIAALAAVAIAVICNTIVDRSYDHVNAIKRANLEENGSNLSFDIVQNAVGAKSMLHQVKDQQHESRMSDQFISPVEFDALAKRKSLTFLKILRCDFSPTEFLKLKNSKLTHLSFSDCMLPKVVFDAMAQMPDLRTVELFRCGLNPDSFTNLGSSKISMLKLRKCGPESHPTLSVQNMNDVSRMRTLVHLELSKSRFEPGAIKALKQAQCDVLNLSYTNVVDGDIDAIDHIQRIEFLDLQHVDSLTCDGLRQLQNAVSIKHVKLNGKLEQCSRSGKLAEMCDSREYVLPIKYFFEKD